MELGLVGSGPASAALSAACSDIDLPVRRLDTADLPADPTARREHEQPTVPSVGAVVAPVGAGVFRAANRLFSRWVAVEIGGLGGFAFENIDAGVSLYTSESACYRCLETRVAAQTDDSSSVSPSGSRPSVRLAGAIAGNQLVSLLSGSLDGGRVTEVPGADRRLSPVPHCECSDGDRPDTAFELTHRSVSTDTSLTRAERAIDDRLGLISQVGERESFPVPYYIAETADTTGFSDGRAAQFAAGVDPDWDRSYMKALGEALERYSAGIYRTRDLDAGSVHTKSDAVSPRAFVRPDDFETPDPSDRITWVTGRSLADGDTVSLPAEFVFFPPPNRRYRPAITTGLGLGNSTVEAVLSGLYEVIERDATMLGWYSTFEPLGLVVDDALDELTKRAGAESLTVTTLLLTQDIDIPVVAAAVHRDGAWPRFAVGSAANLDPTAAAQSALAEALQNWMELRAMGPEQAAEQGGAIAQYASFPAAARAFVTPTGRIHSQTLEEQAVQGKRELDTVCERLSAVGLSAYAARLTPRDVADLGFEAVRVVIPAAQPLFTGDPFFGSRAREVPRSMGFEPQLDRDYHPFP